MAAVEVRLNQERVVAVLYVQHLLNKDAHRDTAVRDACLLHHPEMGMHMHAHTRIPPHTCMLARMHALAHTCTCMLALTNSHTHVCTHSCTRNHTGVYLCGHAPRDARMHKQTDAWTDTQMERQMRTHTRSACTHAAQHSARTHALHACIPAWTHAHANIHACTCAYAHALASPPPLPLPQKKKPHTRTRIDTCVHACARMHTHTLMHTFHAGIGTTTRAAHRNDSRVSCCHH